MFGDRYGLALFLGALAFVATYWRVGVFITDSYAVANALYNLSNGNLAIVELQYSLTLGSQPGLVVAGDSAYGRNFAHVVASLPVLWLLEALTAVFDLRLVVAAGWSGLVVAFADQVGRLVDRHRPIAVGGAVLAGLAFLANVAVATPLSRRWLAFLSLQVTTLIATGLVAVAVYRLLAAVHGRRVGLLVGAGTVLATPLSFWGTIPKRHALSALFVVTVLAAFYASRTADSDRRALAFRALTYAVVALFTWLHALEALAVFAALVPVDLLTARSNHPRRLAVVGLVFALALLPFLVTNAAISGNPLRPPRALTPIQNLAEPPELGGGGTGGTGQSAATPAPTDPPTTGTETSGAAGNATATDGAGTDGGATASGGTPTTATPTASGTTAPQSGNGSGGAPTGSPGPIAAVSGFVTALVAAGVRAAEMGAGFFGRGVGAAVADPARLYYTFVESARVPEYVDYATTQEELIDLAVLEVAPRLGALGWGVAAGVRRLRTRPSLAAVRTALARPARQADLLAVAVAVSFASIYLSRLPLQTQITVRYLVPIMPLGLYGLGRLGAVQRVAEARPRSLVGPYLAVVALGGIALLAVHARFALAIGEAMQLHASLSLASVALIVVWTLVDATGIHRDDRVTRLVIALAAGLTTLFLLFTGFVYFGYADYALPAVDALTGWLVPALSP